MISAAAVSQAELSGCFNHGSCAGLEFKAGLETALDFTQHANIRRPQTIWNLASASRHTTNCKQYILEIVVYVWHYALLPVERKIRYSTEADSKFYNNRKNVCFC